MENATWARIQSWHIVATATRVPERYRAFCGKTVSGPVVDTRPEGKTCETCLRIAGPK